MRWLLTLSLLLLINGGGGAVSEELNLDSLLIESLGGTEAAQTVENLTSLQYYGQANLNGQAGSFELAYLKPDQLSLAMEFGPFRITQTYAGLRAWQVDHNGYVSRLEGFERRELVKQLYMNSMAYLGDEAADDKKYIGLHKFRGEEYHLVELYPVGDDTIRLLLDPVDARQRFQLGHQDNLETVTTFSEYESFQGLLVPRLSETTAADASLSISMWIDSLKINQLVDQERFVFPADQVVDYLFPDEKKSILLPLRFRAGHLQLEAIVNGRKFWFILDSGASANVFHRAVADSLGLAIIGSLPTVGVGGYEQADFVRIDSIDIGGLQLKDQLAGLLDLGQVKGGSSFNSPFGGILGHDFLSRFPVLIDYRIPSLTIFNPLGFQPPPGGQELAFRTTLNLPTIEAKLGAVEGSFLVDLGNAMGLILHPEFVRQHQSELNLTDFRDLTKSVGGIGGSVSGQSALVESFVFGEIQLTDLRVILPRKTRGIIGSRELAGNIGNLILRQFDLLIDYRGRRLLFYPPDIPPLSPKE